jgi:hypothetical protein
MRKSFRLQSAEKTPSSPSSIIKLKALDGVEVSNGVN